MADGGDRGGAALGALFQELRRGGVPPPRNRRAPGAPGAGQAAGGQRGARPTGLWREELLLRGAGAYVGARAAMVAAERESAAGARADDLRQRLAAAEAEAAELRARRAGFSGRVRARAARLFHEQGVLLAGLGAAGERRAQGLERDLSEAAREVQKGERLLREQGAGRRCAGAGLERRRLLLLRLRTALLRVQYDLHHAARFEAFLHLVPVDTVRELLRGTRAEGHHVLQVFRVCYRALEGGQYMAVEADELTCGGGGSPPAGEWVAETLRDGTGGFSDFMEALRHGVQSEVPGGLMEKIAAKAAGTRKLPLYPGGMLLTAHAVAWRRPARSVLLDAKVFFCVEERLSRVAAPEEYARFADYASSPDVRAALDLLQREGPAGLALPTRGRPHGSVIEGVVHLGHGLRGRPIALHFAPASVSNLLETQAAAGLLTESDFAAELCGVYFSAGLRPACLGALFVLEDVPAPGAAGAVPDGAAARVEGGGGGWLGMLGPLEMDELCSLYVRRGLEDAGRHAWPASAESGGSAGDSHALTLVHRRFGKGGGGDGVPPVAAGLGSPALLIVSSPRGLESSHVLQRRALATICDWKNCDAPPMAFLSGSALCELHARVAATTGAEATGLGSHISRGLNALDLLDAAETGAGPGSSAVGGEGDWRWIVDGCEQLKKLRSGALEDAFKSDIEEAVFQPWPSSERAAVAAGPARDLPWDWLAAEEDLMRLANACEVAHRELRVQSRVVLEIEGILGSGGAGSSPPLEFPALNNGGGSGDEEGDLEDELTEVNNRVLSVLQLCTGGEVQSGRLGPAARSTKKSQARYCSRGGGGSGSTQHPKKAQLRGSVAPRPIGRGVRPEWQD